MNQHAPEFPLQNVHTALREARMVVASLGSSLIAYVVVSEWWRRMPQHEAQTTHTDTLRIVVFIVAGMAIFAATVVKGMMLRNAPATPEARLARLRTTTIVAAAMSELPAVLGMVLLFIDPSRRTDLYALLVVSAYMLVRHFPQREAWENYVRRGSDAR